MFGAEKLTGRVGRMSVPMRRNTVMDIGSREDSLNGSFTELVNLHKRSPRERRKSIANITSQMAQVEAEKKEVQTLF